ncbi:MAG: hypothetical protein HY046_01105 [Acidobacteria bacterium]|nr:hypothetical protein [Acidobacteriota bacterium]
MNSLLVLFLLQVQQPALENDYVRVTRDAAVCAAANTSGCGDRVIVALGEMELRVGSARRKMTRGDVAVFQRGESYVPPARGSFFEVNIKPNHPPVQSPDVTIPPEKNSVRYNGERFYVFEERLPPGETRPKHSHSQRVVMQLNQTRLQQWPEGQPEIIVDVVPDRATFNSPVVHKVKNIGAAPLRGIVIEFKPEPRKPASK